MTCKDCIHYDVCNYWEKEAYPDDCEPYWKDGICAYFKSAADVAEVKHGKWKIKRDEYDCEYVTCSVCKEEFYPADADTVDATPNYCMNCGARMDGGNV